MTVTAHPFSDIGVIAQMSVIELVWCIDHSLSRTSLVPQSYCSTVGAHHVPCMAHLLSNGEATFAAALTVSCAACDNVCRRQE